jgi:predicted hotdog family 3-hydroxylacyl-ACP dehydratase
MIDINIEDLIPHRNSMKLIDEILEIDDDRCITTATVSSSWPLFRDGYVHPIVLIELAAQKRALGQAGLARGNQEGKVFP